MSYLQNLSDFQKNAQSKLPKDIYNYFASGAGEQITLNQNQSAFQKFNLKTNHLNKIINKPNLKTRILGKQISLPFGFAPCAMHKLAHQKGQMITAHIAYKQDLCFTLSTLSTTSLKQIQQYNKQGIRLLQLYILKDRKITQLMIRMAQKYGFQGIVITVDAQVIGKRVKDQRNKFIPPKDLKLQIINQIQNQLKNESQQNFQRSHMTQQRDLSLNWNFITWLKSITNLPIIIKGILAVDDAILGCQYGVDAIWISNHGGRQLDEVSATIDVLPLIIKEVKQKYPKVEVYIDGGIRYGLDVFKCLALGADYVFLGRAIIYSLVQGQQGLNKMVNIIKQQIIKQMINTDINTIQQIKNRTWNFIESQSKL